MPIFDYRCPQCPYSTEINETFNHAPELYTCPGCGTELVRQPSAPSFVIKGFSAKTGYSSKDSE